MEEHGAEGAACQTLITRDALLLVELNNAIFLVDGVCGTPFTALRYTALLADDWHPYYGMWIKNHDPHAALFGVVYILPSYAAGQFTDFAPGTSFRDYSKMHGLPPVDQKSAWKSSYT
jgi:hypothetical protein